MAPGQGASVAVPPNLRLPPGIDPMTYLLSMPALSEDKIPPGADRTMTLDSPDQIWYLVVAITCIAIPGLFLLIRVYTKLSIVRSFEIADYFIFLAFPLIVVEVVVGYYMVKWGAGVHQWQITLGQLFQQLYWANVGQIIYCPLSFVVKMAILLQYLRLFAPSRSVNAVMWYGAWLTIASCLVFYTIFTFWTMFYCHPRQAIWNKLTPGAKCHDVNDIIISQGAFNMASDIVILVLPTSSLWSLNVPLGRKIVVTLLFATGLLACAASAMRIVFTTMIAPVLSQADVSHNGLFIGLWTEAEVSLGFIVACALCLPKLFQAKGGSLKRALSKASSPFSTMRSTVRSVSRRSTATFSRRSLKSGTHGSAGAGASRDEAQMQQVEGPHRAFTFQEGPDADPEMQRPERVPAHLQTETRNGDAYALPGGTTTTGSSSYSQSSFSSQRHSLEHEVRRQEEAEASHRAVSSRASTSTQRYTREQMTPEQLRAELARMHEFDFAPRGPPVEGVVREGKVVWQQRRI